MEKKLCIYILKGTQYYALRQTYIMPCDWQEQKYNLFDLLMIAFLTVAQI